MDRSRSTPVLAMERRGEFADSEVASRIDSRIMTRSCSQLLQRVDCLVRVLRSPGIKPGDRVGTLASNLPRAPLLTTGTDAVGTVAFHPALKYGSLAWGHS